MKYSILNYKIVKENIDFRYESEFFLPKYIMQENTLCKIDTVPLSSCVTFSNGRSFDSKEFCFDGDVYIAKIGDVTQKRTFQSWEMVHKKHFSELNATYLKHNDILMTLTGDPPDVGKVQLIYKPPVNKLSWNQRVALLRLKKSTAISSAECLFVILSSIYCRNHIERWAKGIRQRNVGNPAVLNMAVPILSQIQDQLTISVQSSFSLLDQSKELYAQAEALIISELGLTNWQGKHRLSFVKKYSDTVEAERIDAEYFQPKYEEIIKAIKRYKGGWDTLGNLVSLNTNNFKPKEKQEYRYVELANIGTNGEITDCITEEGQHLPNRARRKMETGDVIVSSVEGSLSSIAMTEKEYHHALCSTGFHVVNSKSYNSETMLVLMKSIVGQLQLKKGCSGTILTAINKDEFRRIILPIVDNKIQSKIQRKITKSFQLRKESKRLLECAKQAVEVAIEENEKTTLRWLKKQAS